MEATYSSEMSVDFYRNTRRYMPEDTTLSVLKNAVFSDVAPCRTCVNRRYGGTYRLHLQGRKIRERGTSVSRWRRHIPEDSILHNHRRENIKSSGIALISTF
jgi:hypothetical protein